MTILLAGGDSFTYGNELADCDPKTSSKAAWSAMLAASLGMSYSCVANSGLSNASIARHVMIGCTKLLKQNMDVAVAVMWSFPGRYEFRFTYNTMEKNSPWYSITPWTHEPDESIILKTFHNFKKTVFDHYKKNQLQAQVTSVAKFSELYYKHVGDSEYWKIYTSLKEILFLQQWLESKHIPYVFTYVDDILFKNNVKLDVNMQILLDSINSDAFYHFEGFYKWATTENYPFGTTHPLELAHEHFSQKIVRLAQQRLVINNK